MNNTFWNRSHHGQEERVGNHNVKMHLYSELANLYKKNAKLTLEPIHKNTQGVDFFFALILWIFDSQAGLKI